MAVEIKSQLKTQFKTQQKESSALDADLSPLLKKLGQSDGKNDLWAMVIYPPFWNPASAVLEKGVLLSNRVDALCQFYPTIKNAFWMISDSGAALPLVSREADALLYALPEAQAARLGMLCPELKPDLKPGAKPGLKQATESFMNDLNDLTDDLKSPHVQELSAKTIWQLASPSEKELPQSLSLFQGTHGDISGTLSGSVQTLRRHLQTAVDFSETSLSDETGLGFWLDQVATLHQQYGLKLKLQVQIPFESMDLTHQNASWTDAQKTALTQFLLKHPDWANWMTWVPPDQQHSDPVAQSAIYLFCGSIWQENLLFLNLARAGGLVCFPNVSALDMNDLDKDLKVWGPVQWKACSSQSMNSQDWPQEWLGFWAECKTGRHKTNLELSLYLDPWAWHERVLSALSAVPRLKDSQFAGFSELSSESFRRQLKSQWGVSVENWVYHKEALGLLSHSLTDFHRFYLGFQVHFVQKPGLKNT